MARILITGGAGYVGSHCAKVLAAAGHEGVEIFDSLLFGYRELVRWGPLIQGDIRNAAELDAVFSCASVSCGHAFRRARLCRGVGHPRQADIMTST